MVVCPYVLDRRAATAAGSCHATVSDAIAVMPPTHDAARHMTAAPAHHRLERNATAMTASNTAIGIRPAKAPAMGVPVMRPNTIAMGLPVSVPEPPLAPPTFAACSIRHANARWASRLAAHIAPATGSIRQSRLPCSRIILSATITPSPALVSCSAFSCRCLSHRAAGRRSYTGRLHCDGR